MVLVYTTLGGMLSVLVTDYLQFIIMGIGLVVVSVLVATHVSWTSLVDGVQKQLGTGAFNPLVSPEMGVTYVLWQALNQLAVVLTWQTVIQRVLASRDAGVARQVYIKTSFFFVGRFLIPAFWGMAALVALDAARMPANSLHAMPTFLATLLPTGLIGLVIASMLAAEMSTDSSYLLTWSSILYNDIIAPLRKTPFSERQGLYVNRVVILAIGVFLLFYGLWYQLPGRVWDYLSITGNIYLSSISVLVVACCYWKRANRTGAIAAIVGGALAPILFLIAGWSQYVAIAGLASFGLAAGGMIFGSLLTPGKNEELDGGRDNSSRRLRPVSATMRLRENTMPKQPFWFFLNLDFDSLVRLSGISCWLEGVSRHSPDDSGLGVETKELRPVYSDRQRNGWPSQREARVWLATC